MPAEQTIHLERYAPDAKALVAAAQALADERKLLFGYVDKDGRRTERVVWPVAVGFFDSLMMLAAWCETRVAVDTPVNIHLTGCHHSCAQHFISEIGLLACKVQESEDGDPIEGYHILVGGGFGPNATLGRDIYRDVKAQDAPRRVEGLLKAYMTHRASPQESFLAFSKRHDVEALKAMCDEGAAE